MYYHYAVAADRKKQNDNFIVTFPPWPKLLQAQTVFTFILKENAFGLYISFHLGTCYYGNLLFYLRFYR